MVDKYLWLVLVSLSATGLADVPAQFSAWGTAGPELKPIPAGWTLVQTEFPQLPGRAFSPEQQQRGFFLFAPEPFAPLQSALAEKESFRSPTDQEEPNPRLASFATPGEYEPVALGLYALEDCRGLQAEVTELRSERGHSIAKENLDVRVSRAVPVVISSAARTYRLEPFLLEKRLRFQLNKGAARLVWLTIYVPSNTAAGDYEGTISVRRPGQRPAQAPIFLSVLPCSLPRLPFETPMYYPRPAESDAAIEQELIDMREHGASVPIPAMEVRVKRRDQKFGPDDMAETVVHSQRLLSLIRKVYGDWRFPLTFEAGHQIAYYWDQSRNWFAYWPHSAALEKDLGAGIDLMLRLAKSNAIPALRAYLSDEGGAHNLLDETIYYNRWVKDHFPQIQTTATIGGGMALGFDEIGQLAGAVDFFSANRFTPEIARTLAALRRPFGVYNGAGPTPTGARYFFGFYGYKTGAEQIGQWSYSFGESIFAGNGLRLDDEGYVYQAPDGPLPSIQWEAVREGIDDSRYVERLRSLLLAAHSSREPRVHETAQRAQEVLNRIWAGIGWDFQPMQSDQKAPAPPASTLRRWRRQIAEQILELERCGIQPVEDRQLQRVAALDLPWVKPLMEELTFGPELLTNSTLETSLSPWRVEAWKGGGKGELDPVEHHSGKCAVRIQVPPEDGNAAVTVLVWPRYGENKLNLSLEGGHTFEFSVWAKWRNRGMPPEVRLNLPPTAIAATKSGQGPSDAQGWRRLFTRAKLKAQARPNYLAVWVQGPGTVWLDDLSLREVVTTNEPPSSSEPR